MTAVSNRQRCYRGSLEYGLLDVFFSGVEIELVSHFLIFHEWAELCCASFVVPSR